MIDLPASEIIWRGAVLLSFCGAITVWLKMREHRRENGR